MSLSQAGDLFSRFIYFQSPPRACVRKTWRRILYPLLFHQEGQVQRLQELAYLCQFLSEDIDIVSAVFYTVPGKKKKKKCLSIKCKLPLMIQAKGRAQQHFEIGSRCLSSSKHEASQPNSLLEERALGRVEDLWSGRFIALLFFLASGMKFCDRMGPHGSSH